MSIHHALSPVLVVRLFYFSCSAAIVTVRSSPPLRQRFLAYGARAQHSMKGQTDAECSSQSSLASRLMDRGATINVPHGWFAHFYFLSIISTGIWLLVLLQPHESVFLSASHALTPESAQSRSSAIICLLMMLVQGVRRLYESIRFSKSSISQMWVGHYLFGLAFYSMTNIALWIESVGMPLPQGSTLRDLILTTSSFNLAAGSSLFILASLLQNRTHAYLAGLKKYTLPNNYLFKHLVAPHYTAECIIYLALAMVAAPQTSYFNWTVMCAVLVTTINLGITAEGTKLWMLEKFRDQQSSVLRRWRLIPGIW